VLGVSGRPRACTSHHLGSRVCPACACVNRTPGYCCIVGWIRGEAHARRRGAPGAGTHRRLVLAGVAAQAGGGARHGSRLGWGIIATSRHALQPPAHCDCMISGTRADALDCEGLSRRPAAGATPAPQPHRLRCAACLASQKMFGSGACPPSRSGFASTHRRHCPPDPAHAALAAGGWWRRLVVAGAAFGHLFPCFGAACLGSAPTPPPPSPPSGPVCPCNLILRARRPSAPAQPAAAGLFTVPAAEALHAATSACRSAADAWGSCRKAAPPLQRSKWLQPASPARRAAAGLLQPGTLMGFGG
jgi:hypothetical protein